MLAMDMLLCRVLSVGGKGLSSIVGRLVFGECAPERSLRAFYLTERVPWSTVSDCPQLYGVKRLSLDQLHRGTASFRAEIRQMSDIVNAFSDCSDSCIFGRKLTKDGSFNWR